MIIRLLFRRLATGLALAPLALSATPALAQAQAEAAATAASDPAYGDLYAAMVESVDQRVVVDAALAALGREFSATPVFAAAEAKSPGLIAELLKALRPIFVTQSERVKLRYRPATPALFARHLNPAEATSIASFYRSDLGRKQMGGMARSFSPDATLSTLAEGTPVTREQVQTDLGNATSAALSSLTREDLAELGRMALARPELLKLSQISAGVQELRVQMENEPLTAEENAALMAVIEDVFGRRLLK